jgi:hypothetical protein
MKTHYDYHTDADILEVYFSSGNANAAVNLTPDIILHFDAANKLPISLIFNNFSALVQTDKYGSRMFRLQVDRWPVRLRPIVWQLLASAPVKAWLETTSYRPPHVRQAVPLATIKQPHALIPTA